MKQLVAPVASDEQDVVNGTNPALRDALVVFRKWMHLPDPGAIFVTLGAVVANRGAGDPVWALIVGPPGSGKSESLHVIQGLNDVHQAATFTEAALLSGVRAKEVSPSAKGGLLREIGEFGIILCKDFGSVLSMQRDARALVLAALREIYDGSWTRHVGSDGGRTLHWEGKVGLIAGCTPAIDSHHAVMGSMGERFIMYRVPPVDGNAQVRVALQRGTADRQMRHEMEEAAAAVLDSAYLATPALSESETDRLIAVAEFAVRARSAVERESYHTRDIELIPEPEAPARMALALARLLAGLIAVGVARAEAWRLVAKMALDSMPALRQAVLRCLGGTDHAVGTRWVAEHLGYPTNTTRRALEDLAAHSVVNRDGQGGNIGDLWSPTDWALARWWAFGSLLGTRKVISPQSIREDISGEQPMLGDPTIDLT